MTLSMKEIRKRKNEAENLENREIMREWKWLMLTYGVSFTSCLRLKKQETSLKVKWTDDNGDPHNETIDADEIYNEDVYNKFLVWAGYSHQIIETENRDENGEVKQNKNGKISISRKLQVIWPSSFEDTDKLIDQLAVFITEVYPYKCDPKTFTFRTDKKYDPQREKYAHIKDTQKGTDWLEGTLSEPEGVTAITVGRRIMEAKYALYLVSDDDGFADPNVGLTISHNYGMNYKRSEIARFIYGIIEASSGLLSSAEGEAKLAQDIATALSERLGEIISELDIDKDKKLMLQEGAEDLIKEVILKKIKEARKKERNELSQMIVNGLFEEWYQIDEKAKPTPELIERVLERKIDSGERFKLIKQAQEEEAAKVRREKLA